MREVGAQLRQARLARGEELDEVAEHLRIKPSYLLGLEQGDLSVMPGRTYALGFLRSYADYLGFDGEDLIAQIRSSVADLTAGPTCTAARRCSESRLPKLPILVVSLAALAGVYAGWAYVDDRSRTEIELVAEVPDDLRSGGHGAAAREGARTARRARCAAPAGRGARHRHAQSRRPTRPQPRRSPSRAIEQPIEPASGPCRVGRRAGARAAHRASRSSRKLALSETVAVPATGSRRRPRRPRRRAPPRTEPQATAVRRRRTRQHPTSRRRSSIAPATRRAA